MREHLQIIIGNKILLPLLMFFSLSTGISWSQVVLSEDFSDLSGSTPPTGWSNIDISSGGIVWAFDNPGERSIDEGSTDFDDAFAILDSDYFCESDEEASLESPEFDVSSALSPVILQFDNSFRFYLFGESEAHVEIWDGAAWNTVLVMTSSDGYGTANTKSIDITEAAGGADDAKVRFRWVNGYCDWYWAIDNVSVTILPPPPPCDDPEVVFPESVAATSSSTVACAIGTVAFSLDEEMPEALGITYVWERSTLSEGPYTSVSSELTSPYFTYEPEEEDGGYFRCKIYCNDEEILTSSATLITVSIPVAPELTNGERCGPGSVTLSGSIEDGTIYWYEEEVGGTPFATGEEISTPSISGTTTFYATGGASPSYYVGIGTGTSSSSSTDEGPFNIYYRRTTMQLMYKKDQLAASGGLPGLINEMKLKVTELPAYEMPAYTISVKTVPATMESLSWQTDGFTEVFGGSDFNYLPATLGWQSFPFTEPVSWDGNSHIVVQICWSQVQPDYDASGTHEYTSTSGQMLYDLTDDEGNSCGETGTETSDLLPNAQFLFSGCETSREPVQAIIHQVPELTFEEDEPSICENQSIELVASSTESTDTIKWYASESAATPFHTGSTYTTPDLTETTTYYIASSNENCTSERAALTVTVNPYPDVAAGDEEVCSGYAVTLNATSSNEDATFTWYSTETSTEVLSSSASFTTPALTASTSYFVAADINGCSNGRTEVEVTVNQSPEITATPEDEEICLFGSTTITATSSLSGTTFEWFASATGTESLGTGTTFETPVIFSTTSYFVEGTSSDGCISEREEIVLTVNNPEITAVNAYYICDPHSVTLTAEAAEGATIGWYESSSDEEPIATGSSFTTPVISETTTYYVASTENGCRSYMDAVTVYRETYDFEIEEFAFCPNEEYLAIPLSAATTPETTIYWYSDEGLYDLVHTGESYIAPTPESTTTYYVTAEGENCTTDPREVTITVYPLPSVSIEPESELVCSGEFVTFIATPLDGQTYEYIWTPTGTEGATLTTDEPGMHTVLITSVDYGCSITQTVVLDTVPAPYVAGFDYYPEIFTNPLLYVFAPTDTAHLLGYSWDFGDGHTSEEFEVHHEYAEFGTYTVTFHFYNECDTNSISLEIYVHPSTSIDHSELNHQVDVYPNPTNQDLNISITDGNQITKVSVYNHLGQLMLHEMVNNENKYSFSVAPLAQGTYYILIDTRTGQQAIKKFVVQH